MQKPAKSILSFAPRFESLEVRDVPTYLGNQLFPLDNPWNQRVDSAPVSADSAAIINRIDARKSGAAPYLHADFANPQTDGGFWGIPVTVVDSSTPKVSVLVPSFGYPGESDLVSVPIPANAQIEGDYVSGPSPSAGRGDSHLIVYDKTANVVYELYQAIRPSETVFPYGGTKPVGQWGAYQISVWDLKANSFRTVGKTSADAAGLPILPGLVRPDEANPVSKGGQGRIDHAIRVTFQQTRDAFVFPASHEASSLTASDLPRMGERFRLKSGFVIPSNWSAEAKAIATAMKEYGLIVADNGSDLFFSGLPSTDWNGAAVRQVQSIGIGSFEVVDLTPKVSGLSVASGPAAGGTSVTITGQNFAGAAGRLTVLFGTTPAASVTVLSDTQVVAVAPAGTAGTVDVRVRSGKNEVNTNGQSQFWGYGTSAVVAADRFTYTAGANTAPTVSAISNQSITAGGTTGAVAFTVGDAETPAASLAVTAAVSDAALLPAGSVVLGGSGANRTVTVTPAAGRTGTATVTLTVTDGGGLTATRAFTVTVSPATAGKPYAVGTDAGPVAAVTLYNPDGTVKLTARPFGNAYTGGVRVAVGDVTGDGVADVVAGTNGGTYLQLRVVDGATGAVSATNLLGTNWYSGAVSVAAGDVDGDGVMDIAAGTSESGPRVQVFKGGTWAKLADFQAGPAANFWGKTEVALGDVTGDGKADLVAAGTYADGNRLFGYDGTTLRAGVTPAKAFADQALGTAAGSGVYLAVGDLTGDGFADVVVGAGGWGNGKVTAYSGKSLAQSGTRVVVADFAAAGLIAADGVRVAARDVDGDGKADILTGAGATAAVYAGATLPAAGLPPLLRQHATGLLDGVFVG